MTPLQNRLYFREWGRVRNTCKAQGLPIPDRHGFHVKALGRDKSHLDFTNSDLDRVLAEFKAVTQPADLVVHLRLQDMARRRLIYSLSQVAPEPYWRAIARDKFGTDDPSILDMNQLRQLRITLASRTARKAA